jgi:hypothetical protein
VLTRCGVVVAQLIDVGRQLMTNRLSGYLNGRVLFFLQNLNISPRPIWITRHGESQNNVLVSGCRRRWSVRLSAAHVVAALLMVCRAALAETRRWRRVASSTRRSWRSS